MCKNNPALVQTPPPFAHTHTHTEYITLIAFPLQQLYRDSESILRHMYILPPLVYTAEKPF